MLRWSYVNLFHDWRQLRASSYEPGWSGWPRSRQPGWKFSHMKTSARLPGQNFLDELALLSQQSGQNGIILPCIHFHFKSIRISFIRISFTIADKAMIVANDTSLCGAVTGLKFPIWTDDKASQPGHRAHMKRPVRGQWLKLTNHSASYAGPIFCTYGPSEVL